MTAPRYFPNGDGESADELALTIRQKAGSLARLMGSSATAALLAGLAREHHLKSIPRGTPARRSR